MNFRSTLSVLNLDDQAFRAASNILGRLVTGWDDVYTSPIALETDPNDILSGWDEIFQANLSKLNSVLELFEMNNRKKFGPRSIAVPWYLRRESLTESFGIGKRGLVLSPVLSPTRRLRPLSLESALSYLKNNSSSGFPTMAKKLRVKGGLLASFKQELSMKYPCVLFTRTQEVRKTRNVWGFPASDTLNEMRFYRPLLDLQKKATWRAALREPLDVDLAMTKLIDHAKLTGIPNVSMDFSKFDNTCKSDIQRHSFNEIKGVFQPAFHEEIDYVADRFNTIGIVTPDGILSGPHGVPSGSTFTNEIDSIGQFSAVASSRCVANLSISQVQGDDGVYPSSDPDGLFKHLEECGLVPSDLYEKTFYSDEYVVYLQSLYHPDYRNQKTGIIGGIYSVYRALLRIVYLERFDDFSKDNISGADYFAIRTISILENCKNHPLFEELVRYVYKLDKYKLTVSDLGLKSFVKARLSKEGKDVNFRNWSYGEDVSGIRNFETFKIIKELAV